MALTINTNIINDADNYSLDAKQVKGGFGVVAKQTDLAGLPNATIVKGSFYYAADTDKFYQYNGTAWVEKQFGGGNVDDVQVNGTTVLDTTTKIANVPLVSSENDGAMSKGDKTKLDAFALESLSFDPDKNLLYINGIPFILTRYSPIPEVYICGGLFKTAAEFAALTKDELLAAPVKVEKKASETAGYTLTTTWGNEENSIYYIMIKDGYVPISGTMSAGGIVSPFTGEDIMNPNIWRAPHADIIIHDDILIADVTYHVYGYRTRFTNTTQMNVVVGTI